MSSPSPNSRSESLLGSYFQFLRSPDLNSPPAACSTRRSLKEILHLYGATIVLTFIILFILNPASAQLFSHANVQTSRINEYIDNVSAIDLFVLALLVSPLIEELVFRLPLRPFGLNISISLSVVTCGLALFSKQHDLVVTAWMVVALNGFVAMQCPDVKVLEGFYEEHPRLIFYCLSILSSALYVSNYETSAWLLPLSLLPLTIMSVLYGFIRIRYGFRWVIFAHCLHNGCWTLPLLLAKTLGSEQMKGQRLPGEGAIPLAIFDKLLAGVIDLYLIGSASICIFLTWKLLREWLKSGNSRP